MFRKVLGGINTPVPFIADTSLVKLPNLKPALLSQNNAVLTNQALLVANKKHFSLLSGDELPC